MSVYQVLSLVGTPSVCVMLLGAMIAFVKEQREKTKALNEAVQELLKNAMYKSYLHYKKKGWAPIYARENFQRMYELYHVFGGNGVMDDFYEKFFDLPEKEPLNVKEGA